MKVRGESGPHAALHSSLHHGLCLNSLAHQFTTTFKDSPGLEEVWHIADHLVVATKPVAAPASVMVTGLAELQKEEEQLAAAHLDSMMAFVLD